VVELEATEKADIAMVVTEWNELRALGLTTLRTHARRRSGRSPQYLSAGAGARPLAQLHERWAGGQPSKCVDRDLLSETIALGTVSHGT
jgi:hypothetical protein